MYPFPVDPLHRDMTLEELQHTAKEYQREIDELQTKINNAGREKFRLQMVVNFKHHKERKPFDAFPEEHQWRRIDEWMRHWEFRQDVLKKDLKRLQEEIDYKTDRWYLNEEFSK